MSSNQSILFFIFGSSCVKIYLIFSTPFLKVLDQNSNPASDLMCDIFFMLLLKVENCDLSCSMPSIHACDVLSRVPIGLKNLEYLSHDIEK